ncbi:MAG: hypothetical protein IPI30_19445 [Saprospiraceae bacterium]|nr:hypothetical protein [Candidatus Vicinibacter affinis]
MIHVFPKILKNEISDQFDWKFDIKVSGNDEPTKIRDLFRQIDLFYKTLRSGISPNDRPSMYFKSLMWKYAQHLNRQWDKRTIKQIHFNGHILSQQLEHSEIDTPLNWANGEKVEMNYATSQNPNNSKETHLLWRDLLGLSTQQTWMSYGRTEVNKSHTKTSKSKIEIARFQSPIFFKPLRSGSNTYRVLFEVPVHLATAFKEGGRKSLVMESQILGEWFKISGSNNELMLPYPEYFNFTDFFKFIFSINLREYIMDGTNIYSFERGERVLRNKRHGSKIRERENNNWIEKTNPDYFTIQQIYAQLSMQIEEIQSQNHGE